MQSGNIAALKQTPLSGYPYQILVQVGKWFQMNLEWSEHICNVVHAAAQLLMLKTLI